MNGGVHNIVKNDGQKLNQNVFGKSVNKSYNGKAKVEYFDEFYESDFDKVQKLCEINPIKHLLKSE